MSGGKHRLEDRERLDNRKLVKSWHTHIIAECEANAFLHHMVRNIVGTLATIGRGDAQPDWIDTLLQQRDRRTAGITAPSMGLTLTQVDYPSKFGIRGL